ncbi:MAG: pyruvate carboxylase subunit B [Firmicutes bacterium]|nr:pyruvate carboxylase subunit B [Bacillota bacterium]
MSQPVKITDETLRDAQQSIFATRMRTGDMEAVAAKMDQVGYHTSEMSGGATFDVAIRYLNEDPWERIRILRELMPRTRLQMHFRGQNLLGYRHYADDLVVAFINYASKQGIDVFRIFDSLDDERNLMTCIKTIKACGKQVQIQMQYSLTELKLGGPVYNIDYYVRKAKTFEEIGADSISIADTCGLPSPYDAYDLVRALKKELSIPIGFHTHYNSGMASMACLKAVEAGVDIIDTASAPFALRSSFPAVESMVFALQGTTRDPGLDMDMLVSIGKDLEEIGQKYREYMDNTRISLVDAEALINQVPGGMLTNLIFQLKEANAVDRLGDVCAEIPRVRRELGYPPLATPSSQIIVAQAVQNVLFGRYKILSRQVRDYAYGLYGRTPHPIDPDIRKMLLKNYEKGETPITCRPADLLEPELEKAKEATAGLARDMGDVLIYAIFPDTGMRFLRCKYGLESG